MENSTKTWDHIPPNFKRDVVKYLDAQSRFRLRICSKADRDIVDSCPIFPEIIALDFHAQTKVIVVKFPNKRGHRHDSDTNGQLLIEDFVRLISHPKSIAEYIRLNFSSAESSLEFLSDKLELLEHGSPIKTKRLKWETRGTCRLFPYFLEYFDTKYLKEIVIERPPLDLEEMNKITETKQWRSAEILKATYHLPKEISLDSFIHVNSFEIRVFEMTTKVFLEGIMKFIARNPLPGSYFSIFADKLDLSQMAFLFYDPVPIGKKLPNCQKMLNYAMPTASNKLILCKSDVVIEGVVCRMDHLDEDFKLVRHACTDISREE